MLIPKVIPSDQQHPVSLLDVCLPAVRAVYVVNTLEKTPKFQHNITLAYCIAFFSISLVCSFPF